MAGVDEIIRQWVQKVEATGELRDIPGFGEPLKFDDGYLQTPDELRMAYKVLKNAGYVPAEIEMLQKLFFFSFQKALDHASEVDVPQYRLGADTRREAVGDRPMGHGRAKMGVGIGRPALRPPRLL